MRIPSASLSPLARRRADEFAALLEGSRSLASPELQPLVALATTLRPAPLAPRPEFRAELRATLVATATERERAPAAVLSPATKRRPATEPAAPAALGHRLRGAVATVLALALISGAGAALASSRALPGDPLYGLKRGLEGVQLDLARSEEAKGREYLEQAESRLTEAEALAASEDARSAASRNRISTALTEMQSATSAGADALTASYVDTGDPEPLRVLDRFVNEQRERLGDLESILDPSLVSRVVSLTQALATLHSHLSTLLSATGSGATAIGPASTESLALARSSGDGWAVSRLVDQVGSVTGVGSVGGSGAPGDAAAGSAGGTGGLGSELSGTLDDTLGAVTGAGSAPNTGSAATGGGAPGIPLPTLSLPPIGGGGGGGGGGQPGPAVTLPTIPVPQVSLPQVSVPPVSVPPLPPVSLPPVSLPPVLPSGLPCVPLPPVTHC